MKSTSLRLTVIASFVILLTFATTIPNRGVGSRAIVFNGTNQYARVTLPNSAPWTSLGSFKIMGRLRGMSSISGYIASLGIPEVSFPFTLFQNGGGDPERIDLYDNRDAVQDYHAPNTFTDIVFKLQYDPANSRWTLESWKADGTGYVVTTETITTTTNWNLGGHYLTLGANAYGVGFSDAHVDWWCWQQGADALGSGNFPGAEVPTGTFLVKYTFDNDDGADSSGNGLNLTLTNSPTFEDTPGGPGSGAQISGISVASNCNTSALINFNTDVAARAYVEYGTTTSYGSSTIDDPVRFYTEHAIPLTGLTANTTYHFRVNANSNGTTQSADQTFTTASSGAACAALPAQVDSRMPDMTGATEYVVKASCTGVSNCFTNFQTAINTAGTDNGKRFVTVDAGLSFTGSFTLPANSDGNWIIIRSSAYANLPEGKRVAPTDTSSMFKVVANTQNDGAIETAAGANHIRIIGMESTIDPSTAADSPGGAIIHSNINFNKNVGGNSANLAKFIGFDRCYIHGLTSKNNRRGFYWEGEDNFIIDSYISDFHDINSDGQAILLVTGKRNKILNNTLISDGENFMWGGTGLSVSGYVIGGLEFARNHMYKPCSWKVNGGCGGTYGGFDWKEKNLFECKTCAQLLVFGNYFGGTTDSQGGYWPDAQSKAINLKLEQNSAGPTTCDLMEDLTIYKNFGKNMHSGMDVVGRTVGAQGCTNKPDRVLVRDNVFEYDATTWTPEVGASSGSFNATGWSLSGVEDLQVIHNTVVNANPTQSSTCNSVYSDGSMITVGDPVTTKWAGFVYKDNISDYRACGVAGGGCNGNDATCSLNGVFTGWVFTNNGIMRSAGVGPNYPSGQLWVTSWGSQLVNFNSGLDGNYRVASGSTWKNAATDGKDLGADIDGVERATANSPTGNWPAP